ncbi:28937_t:CDS:2 [Racocetra persica]|uniref:28937_t:CDS:1 n=1 Tax=Racocetra persica TaxID=160502 RepID=A0ACA9LNA2_9GLOM|nr:28937_t:CDS:2 [Racocetra persica]
MAAPLRQEKGFLAPQSLNLNYPAPLKKFSEQLGGHGEILSMNEDSMIIKPCNELEREFYENSVLYPGFARWMPKYYGTLRLHDSQPSLLDQQENVLTKFKKPCVMDVKLGTQLWGKDADERKRQKSIQKAESTTSSSMGIRITASRVYGKSSDNYTYYSREFCRRLTPDTIMTCFADFFMAEISLSQRRLVIDRFIEDLTLFSEDLENHDVRLHFAHSHFEDGIGKDEGCLLGLRNAIRCLKQVLNEMTN